MKPIWKVLDFLCLLVRLLRDNKLIYLALLPDLREMMIFIFTTRCWKWWGQQSLLLFSISILCFIFLKGWRHHQVLLLSGQGRHRVFLDIYHHLSVKLGHRSFENFMNFSDVNKFMKNFGSKFSTLELRSLELVYRWDLPKNDVAFCK